MMQNEFEKIIGAEVSTSDYETIEKVYTWHPVIKDTTGKQQIADLYKIGGMPLIRNMMEAAEIMKSLDDEERKIKDMLHKILVRKEVVASGNLEYERCRKELEDAFNSSDTASELERMLKAISQHYDTGLIVEIRNDLGF